jgi:hypothetical protein
MDTLQGPAGSDRLDRQTEWRTVLPTGAILTVPVDAHGPDTEAARLWHPDLPDSLTTGAEALALAGRLQTIHNAGTAHGAATQVAQALDRDAAILTVDGIGWQEALQRLSALADTLSDATLADWLRNLTRGTLRNALCSARKRQAGGTARS